MEWDSFNTWRDKADRIDVYRTEPRMIKGEKIDGLLISLPVGTSVADINETVYKLYAGGVYRIKLVEDDGRLRRVTQSNGCA